VVDSGVFCSEVEPASCSGSGSVFYHTTVQNSDFGFVTTTDLQLTHSVLSEESGMTGHEGCTSRPAATTPVRESGADVLATRKDEIAGSGLQPFEPAV
jgi:hypothetical protein